MRGPGSGPQLRQAREFQRSEDFPVFLCDYQDSPTTGTRWDEQTKVVKVNRTEICDEVHYLATSPGLLMLPRRNEEIEVFAKEMTNLVKVLQEDPETGSREYRYRKVGEDHYRHATNYFFLAAQRVPISPNVPWGQKPLGTHAKTAASWKVFG